MGSYPVCVTVFLLAALRSVDSFHRNKKVKLLFLQPRSLLRVISSGMLRLQVFYVVLAIGYLFFPFNRFFLLFFPVSPLPDVIVRILWLSVLISKASAMSVL